METKFMSRLVEMNVELDDHKKATLLLGTAVDKEIKIYRHEFCSVNDHGEVHMCRASRRHQALLAKCLDKVDVLVSSV